MKELIENFEIIGDLLAKYLPYINQEDKLVFESDEFQSHLFDKYYKLNDEEKFLFDAQRKYEILADKNWIQLQKQIDKLTRFEKTSQELLNIEAPGNIKKQHELKHLYNLLLPLKGSSSYDFGGGVGKLAHFLEKNLDFDVTVLEKDPELIRTGKKKTQFQKLSTKFIQANIDETNIPMISSNLNMALGLHTCGNFATSMFDTCIQNDITTIYNFGCCYSKIQNHKYHLSKYAKKDLVFNHRALSAATLSFSTTQREIYDYRLKIMRYKYTFYHYILQKTGRLQFCAMSNARRSLYNHSIKDFIIINSKKFFPSFQINENDDFDMFYQSEENQKLLNYFEAYYSFSRYFGRLLEAYILIDRALYLHENHYTVKILEVFDSKISPRNKVIIATKDSSHES